MASRYVAVKPASLELRRVERLPVVITEATVREHARLPVAATLCDLSAYGCRIECEEARQPGDRVWLRLAGGLPIAATVVWSENGRTGCRFDQGLPRETVRAMTLGIA